MNIEIWQGDITTLDVDAIVNAANASLLGGGGVDGAIHRAAGPGLLAECTALAEVRRGVRCPTGEVRLTAGHQLSARHIIHTVGPRWLGGNRDEAALLANCYWKSLQLAEQLELESIAFPAISCGAYGYPVHQAARIAVTECVSWQRSHRLPIRIILGGYNASTVQALQQAMRELTPPPPVAGSIPPTIQFQPLQAG
ncbi:O-acetyl-ADP-ribose deacetylase [Stenotrophomonas ginsengisoli]|uniref:O-acetyl-ADP-ribose deacetylase n=1 Tax=Stenotrophomonas ginsengisoli TaxID=336566 RepID=UPI0009F8EE5E|nr:O-acetyl-ADP-ribose deacetylase [Stenotrophomonas ginsengisoli]